MGDQANLERQRMLGERYKMKCGCICDFRGVVEPCEKHNRLTKIEELEFESKEG